MKPTAVWMFAVVLFAARVCVLAQQSDYAVKTTFENGVRGLRESIDSARTTEELDSIRVEIDSLEGRFARRATFLDKALHPETFASTLASLRNHHMLAYDRAYLIQTQGITISELEARIVALSGRVDSLTMQRDKLFSDLQEAQRTNTALRETIRRISGNLQARDRLIFALIDSIFLPYDKDLRQTTDVQKEAIRAKLAKTSITSRIYDIAADNVRFIEMTQLQPKDYASLLDQYQQFQRRWKGLSEKITAVSSTSGERTPATGGKAAGKGGKTPVVSTEPSSAPVDSILAEWNTKMNASFWPALMKEFTDKQIKVQPFTNAQSFSASVRAYVDSTLARNEDGMPFVQDVWKARIDKEWREALTKETMLGQAGYAALDKKVSILKKEKFDLQFVLYILLAAVATIGIWRFFNRKPTTAAPPSA
jgi:hypothetical protein